MWIKNFLKNRTFYVNVNGKDSKYYSLFTSVPQGSILSAILFLIFINDVPTTVFNYEHISRALLFADDLFKFAYDHNLKRLQIILQRYLDELEIWLSKWRLKTAAKKCSYNIYTENGQCNEEIHLEIFGNKINKENNPKYLGVHLDQNVSFKHHIEKTKEKCLRKINFIKVLRSKKWDANVATKIKVYNALIRSNVDYAGPILVNVSEQCKDTIESIQYHSMIQILKETQH